MSFGSVFGSAVGIADSNNFCCLLLFVFVVLITSRGDIRKMLATCCVGDRMASESSQIIVMLCLPTAIEEALERVV